MVDTIFQVNNRTHDILVTLTYKSQYTESSTISSTIVEYQMPRRLPVIYTYLPANTTQVIYSGPIARAEPYFENLGYTLPNTSINIADYLLDIVLAAAQQETDRLIASFKQSSISSEDAALVASNREFRGQPPMKHSAPFLTQL